jgi:cysteine desulfurase
MSKIYLDHNATTPVAQEVCDLMLKHLSSEWGNPSSTYSFGAKLKSDIEASRRIIAEFVNCMSSEVIFTGSATESINTALWSATESAKGEKVLTTSAVEHSATLSFCSNAERRGVKTIQIGVDSNGDLNKGQLSQALDARPSIISLMWVNNETGVIFPIEELSQACLERGVLLHVDAVQAAGKIPISFNKLPGITYLSLSAHKFNGPKGVGILVARKSSPYLPLISGGHQERGRRGGTENVAGIIGAGMAASLASRDLKQRNQKGLKLRALLEEGILRIHPNAVINGKLGNRVPNTTSVTFPGIESESLLLMLDKDGICASSGSACLADAEEPSHVIKAMYPQTTQARETVRFSTGLSNTEDELIETLASLERSIKRLSK